VLYMNNSTQLRQNTLWANTLCLVGPGASPYPHTCDNFRVQNYQPRGQAWAKQPWILVGLELMHQWHSQHHRTQHPAE